MLAVAMETKNLVDWLLKVIRDTTLLTGCHGVKKPCRLLLSM